MIGIIRSRTTKSGGSASIFSMASRPSLAVYEGPYRLLVVHHENPLFSTGAVMDGFQMTTEARVASGNPPATAGAVGNGR